MADAAKRAEENIRQLAECSICMNAFTDPRMLPCIHTFCFECLKRTRETAQKEAGDRMPCPLCRKEFTIPQEGVVGLQKNFFMENLLQSLLELTALPSNDSTLKIGSGTEEEIKRIANVNHCTKHTHQLIDYYCADCKRIVCVSCFVESHKLHDCKDVTTVAKELRLRIEKYAWKTANYADKMLSLIENAGSRKTDFLKKIAKSESAVLKRSQELKDMINKHTKSLLDKLSLIKSSHLKEMETRMEEMNMHCTILRSFEYYCTELRLKGSAMDICSSVDQIIARADEFKTDHEAFTDRPQKSVEVSFKAANFRDFLQNANSNVVGVVEETSWYENFAVVAGFSDGFTLTKDVVKINLHRPNELTEQEDSPTTMTPEATATVFNNTMYVIGIGDNCDEIWKCNKTFSWIKCASLVLGRRRHSAAFIDAVLYICGGCVGYTKRVLDSVEAYNALTNRCTKIGKLVQSVQMSGCVPYRRSILIFGGRDNDDHDVSHVQMYDTKENTCTLISKPMPEPCCLMRAVLWETSVILLGWDTCFIFNIEMETWQEREQFKTDVTHFGLILENERIFVVGGGMIETDEDGNTIWERRDDVRYVPLQSIINDKPVAWRVHGKLPKPSLVDVCVNMRF